MDSCYICKSMEQLETHHIIPQKDFNESGLHKHKYHLKKNDVSNLIVLCMTCHDKVDREEIIIDGWNNTSNGKELVYAYNPVHSLTKYSPELIQFINSLKTKYDPMIARIKVKETFNKKISTQSINKIWSQEI